MTPTLSLVKQLIRRDLGLRYRFTSLGFLWSLAKPCAQIVLFYMVFEKLLGLRGGMTGLPETVNYGTFLAVGIITWGFLAGALLQGATAYLSHQHLITRAAFWIPALPISTAVSHWIHYLLAQAALVVILGLAGAHGWEPKLLWLVPISLAELGLAAALIWLLASLQVLARDTLQILEIALMVGFYASPIIYPVGMALGKLSTYHLSFLYLLNPLTPLLALRQQLLLVHETTGMGWIGVPHLFVGVAIVEIALLFALAIWVDRKVGPQIADRL
ncbi:MAG: hypothetical protein GHCLOJNM_01172 [bacterium]|nr:hypothetical protein [bacterium]